MQFVKDPPQNPARAGLAEPQEPAGHPSSPAWLSPKWQLRAAHTSKRGVGTPPLPAAPLQPLAPLPPPRAGGAGGGSPHKTRGVLHPAPRHPGAAGVQGWLWSHMELPMEPQHCHNCTGGQRRCHSQGEDTVLGWPPHPHRGDSASVIVLGSLPHLHGSPLCQGHLCRGTNARVTATPAWGGAEPRPLHHHTCARGQ